MSLKKKQTGLLDTPTEVLQHIASFLPCDSILQMRLTCKTLESTTLDLFAEEFISYQEFFLLDPSRLLRVKNILSTPHLAARVKRVATPLCARDSFRKPNVVPEQGEDVVHARHRWLSAYEYE